MNSSTVVCIPNEAGVSPTKITKTRFPVLSCLSNKLQCNTRELAHSFKVGIALVLVSLLYLIDPLYAKVGENAMWALMTVAVIFEYSAGALLSKGLNRAMGTISGGLLGCLAATLSDQISGTGEAIGVGISIFIFGAVASYSRLIPGFKKIFDYGAMIFILTFNLVIVSGLRDKNIINIARDRLLTIGIGFVICIFVSLVIFPVWSSDELHISTASKFHSIASSFEGCFEEYFSCVEEKDNVTATTSNAYISVLNSKAKDEILARFARWEPWHGKFGFYHPWEKYLEICDRLRELAAIILLLKGCLRSPRQPLAKSLTVPIKEPCEAVSSRLAKTLRELGESVEKMKVLPPGALLDSQKKREQLSEAVPVSELAKLENDDGIAAASFVFLLMEMVDKVDMLTKDVQQLGVVAGFHPH